LEGMIPRCGWFAARKKSLTNPRVAVESIKFQLGIVVRGVPWLPLWTG